MEKTLTLGSLFDGSGGFPFAGMLSGIRPIWASEIEPFPIRVTTKRLPEVKHYGDITKMKGSEVEPVDIITFGSPCQDLSIAGKRVGLGGSRSSLFHEAIRIVKEMRRATGGEYPRYLVWENVPGAFSSNKGRDFHAVIQEIVKTKHADAAVPESEKWPGAGLVLAEDFSLAWRVLDAQHWGVPQRRRRIYLVADLDGGRAGRILFESEGLPWNPKACADEGEDPAFGSSDGVGEAEQGSLMFENHAQDARYDGPLDKALTLTGRLGTGGNNQPFVVNQRTFDVRFTSEGTRNIRANVYETETSRTLDTSGNSPDANQGGVAVVCVEGNGARPSHQGSGFSEGDSMFTLNATEKHCVAYGIGKTAITSGFGSDMSFPIEEERMPTMVSSGANGVGQPVWSTSKNSYHTEALKETAGTLVASDYKDPPTVTEASSALHERTKADGETDCDGCGYVVRRLTPTECARLQGFPDWWCSDLEEDNPSDDEVSFWRSVFATHSMALGGNAKPKTDSQIRRWLKRPHSDSAEYRMWGNGIALPCARYVLTGIAHYDKESFDEEISDS